jgi:hypothetical protein
VKTWTKHPLQILVCTNARAEANPLGSGCGARGEALVRYFQQRVGKLGDYEKVWIARTACQGRCPKDGAAVVIASHGDMPGAEILTEVTLSDCEAIWQRFFGR